MTRTITEHYRNGQAGAGMVWDRLYQHMHVKLFSIHKPNYFVYKSEFIWFALTKVTITALAY
jgi:hypothetical protein